MPSPKELHLPKTLLACKADDDFHLVLKRELEQLSAQQLPLQAGLSQSSVVANNDFQVMILSVDETSDGLLVKAGVFYQGVIAGCSCSDDPTPTDVIAEYCEIQVAIDMGGGRSRVWLVDAD